MKSVREHQVGAVVELRLDTSCTAGCGHCVHGRTQPSDSFAFSKEMLASYRALERYYRSRRDTQLALMFASPFARLQQADLSGFGQVRDVYIPFEALLDLGCSVESLVAKAKAFLGGHLRKTTARASYICLTLNCWPDASMAPEQIIRFVQMQTALLEWVDQEKMMVENIGVTINHNRFPSAQFEVVAEQAFMYLQLYKGIVARVGSPGSVVAVTEKVMNGVHIQGTAERRFQRVGRISLGIRAMCESHLPNELREQLLLTDSGQINFALFPDQVHLQHSMYNIGDRRHKVSHQALQMMVQTASQRSSPGLDAMVRDYLRRAKSLPLVVAG